MYVIQINFYSLATILHTFSNSFRSCIDENPIHYSSSIEAKNTKLHKNLFFSREYKYTLIRHNINNLPYSCDMLML